MPVFHIPFEFVVDISLDEIKRRFAHKQYQRLPMLRRVSFDPDTHSFDLAINHPIWPLPIAHLQGTFTRYTSQKTRVRGMTTPYLFNAIIFGVLPAAAIGFLLAGLATSNLIMIGAGLWLALMLLSAFRNRTMKMSLSAEQYLNRILHT